MAASADAENTRRMRRLNPGWTEFVFSDMVSSPENRAKFVASSIQFCRTWNFDGLDLDWEYPGYVGRGGRPEDKENFAKLLAELRAAFDQEAVREGKPVLLLTAAVGIGPSTAETAYDVPALNRYLDFINLMTYDMYGGWTPDVVGIHSQLYAGPGDAFPSPGPDSIPLSADYAVQWWIDHGALPSKLTLGLASYSRGFTLASSAPGQGPGAPAVGYSSKVVDSWWCEAGKSTYYEIQMLIGRGLTPVFDPVRCGAYIQDGKNWHGYDDEATMRCKANYVKEKGLLGGILWSLAEDDFVQGSPLITAFSQELMLF